MAEQKSVVNTKVKDILEPIKSVQEPVKDKSEEQIAYERDNQMVKGKFIYSEVPKGSLEFVFKKYKNDPVKKYNMKDGEVYEVPRMVAIHLNTEVAYPVHSYKKDDAGKDVIQVEEKIRRCSFQSLDFID